MGRHSKGEDLNNKPFDPKASPETKAKEFDQQYSQNQGKTKSVADNRPSGRHGKK